MSARKQYHKGSEYSEYELQRIEIFKKDWWTPELGDHLLKDLCDKWKPTTGNNIIVFMLHQYELCGATYGIQLYISPSKISQWTIETYEDSGYSKGTIIARDTDFNLLDNILIGFAPKRYTFD